MTTFGDRLRQVREARGWSQEKLGFELEVTKATISKWELNRAEPGLRPLARLRHLFLDDNLTLDWLIDDAVSMKNAALAWKHVSDGGAHYDATPRIASTADELALLVRFRRLPPAKRKALVTLIDEES